MGLWIVLSADLNPILAFILSELSLCTEICGAFLPTSAGCWCMCLSDVELPNSLPWEGQGVPLLELRT